ncbi:MAG: prepilin-type N-terminal cleavage/methylation domain-containing protein [Clostridiales bacterium]|nr:prepilin-type N-terminal cleavage/methylation domain-containing protein [Clostridiales bacterium]
MFRYTKSSKRGFTLLETMLAVALLLIVTLISYEGFMTTLNYAGDTALADRVSNVNAGNCYKTMGQATSSLHGGTSSNALMIKGPGYTGVIQVHAFEESGGFSVFSSGSAYTDDSNFSATTDRHGFVYVARACNQSGHGILGYYEQTDASGNKIYVAKCTEPGCTYSTLFS